MQPAAVLSQLPARLRDAIGRGVGRTICPQCGGGSSAEHSLSVRPLDGQVGTPFLKLSCWRSTCGYYTVVALDPDVAHNFQKQREPSGYEGIANPLPESMLDRLQSDYGLCSKLIQIRGWRVTNNPDELLIPVRDRIGITLGHVTRTVGDGTKRVRTFKTSKRLFIDVWQPWETSRGSLVIVEDSLSAARLSALGFGAIALMGTNMSPEDAEEIALFGRYYNRVYMALDRDAFVKSLGLSRRYRHIVPMLPICLSADIKNIESDADIIRLFGE